MSDEHHPSDEWRFAPRSSGGRRGNLLKVLVMLRQVMCQEVFANVCASVKLDGQIADGVYRYIDGQKE